MVHTHTDIFLHIYITGLSENALCDLTGLKAEHGTFFFWICLAEERRDQKHVRGMFQPFLHARNARLGHYGSKTRVKAQQN